RSLLRQKAMSDRLDATEAILFALARAVEMRDHHTGGHCERLALLSLALGLAMDLPADQLVALHRGGYLHDIGKVGMPDSILFKEGPLNEEEWVVMRSHPVKGVEICKPLSSLEPVLPIIRSHHEKWDGTGYPDRLKGEEIPLLARILQVADIYDALTSQRPYKAPLKPARALEIMRVEMERGWRDPTLMKVFFQLHEQGISKAVECRDAGHEIPVEASLRNLRLQLAG
ncbi:MAG: HD domain-containing protein, partial [Acidobacteria bacterium]|nr:HD domain-containing protein [Acidobacteriota bacterium]